MSASKPSNKRPLESVADKHETCPVVDSECYVKLVAETGVSVVLPKPVVLQCSALTELLDISTEDEQVWQHTIQMPGTSVGVMRLLADARRFDALRKRYAKRVVPHTWIKILSDLSRLASFLGHQELVEHIAQEAWPRLAFMRTHQSRCVFANAARVSPVKFPKYDHYRPIHIGRGLFLVERFICSGYRFSHVLKLLDANKQSVRIVDTKQLVAYWYFSRVLGVFTIEGVLLPLLEIKQLGYSHSKLYVLNAETLGLSPVFVNEERFLSDIVSNVSGEYVLVREYGYTKVFKLYGTRRGYRLMLHQNVIPGYHELQHDYLSLDGFGRVWYTFNYQLKRLNIRGHFFEETLHSVFEVSTLAGVDNVTCLQALVMPNDDKTVRVTMCLANGLVRQYFLTAPRKVRYAQSFRSCGFMFVLTLNFRTNVKDLLLVDTKNQLSYFLQVPDDLFFRDVLSSSQAIVAIRDRIYVLPLPGDKTSVCGLLDCLNFAPTVKLVQPTFQFQVLKNGNDLVVSSL